MDVLITETEPEAYALAAALGSGWLVVYLGGLAELDTSHRMWYSDPVLRLPAVGHKALVKTVTQTWDRKGKVYVALPHGPAGDATCHAVQRILKAQDKAVLIHRVNLQQHSLSKIKKALTDSVRDPDTRRGYDAYRWTCTLQRFVSRNLQRLLVGRFSQATPTTAVSLPALDLCQLVILHHLGLREQMIREAKPTPSWWVETTLHNGIVLRSEDCDFEGKAARYCTMITSGEATLKYQSRKRPQVGPAPFNTYLLVDAAFERWGLSSSQTLTAAARLAEEGRITSPWTAGTHVSPEFQRTVKAYLRSTGRGALFAAQTFTPADGTIAQAIVPRDVSVLPKENLSRPRRNVAAPVEHVYALVWEQAVASQMKEIEIEEQRLQLVRVGGDRVLGEARGTQVLSTGWDVVLAPQRCSPLSRPAPPPIARAGATVKSAVVRKGLLLGPPRLTEHELLEALRELGVPARDSFRALRALWQVDWLRAVPDGIAPSPTAEVVTSFLRRAVPFVVEASFLAKVQAGQQKILEGKDGRVWVQGFVQKVLTPAAAKTAAVPLATAPPFCRKTFKHYDVVLTETGPYFYNPLTKDAIAIEVDGQGEMVPFKTRPVPGTCKVCQHPVLLLSRAKGEDYVYCAECGAQADRW